MIALPPNRRHLPLKLLITQRVALSVYFQPGDVLILIICITHIFGLHSFRLKFVNFGIVAIGRFLILMCFDRMPISVVNASP